MTTTAPERAEHHYKPVGSAFDLFSCREPEVLLSGSAGTGKTRACLEKLHAMAMLNSGMRGLVCRKTATSLGSTTLVTYREHVAKEALESGEVRFYGGSAQEAACFKYANGSVIVIGGMDKASRIMSSEYDVVYVGEATELTEDDWEMITTRLRNGVVSFQQLMADCNPGPPQHWLNQRCKRGQCQMILCRHEDNPKLWDGEQWTAEGSAYVDGVLEKLTGVRYQRLRRGIWAAAEGLVYRDFSPDLHLHKHIGFPPEEWDRYLSVDFGFTNPFACQWWAIDGDGRAYLYREIYMTGRLVQDHAADIMKAVQRGDGHRADVWPPVAVICDHDAEDRATLERHLDVPTVAAHKAVSDGIQAVASRLKPAGDGKPRLYFCRDALVERDPALEAAHKPLCAIDEVVEYVWDTSAKPGAGTGSTARETPLKQNDHSMDAARYLVAQLDLIGRPRIRWMSGAGFPLS